MSSPLFSHFGRRAPKVAHCELICYYSEMSMSCSHGEGILASTSSLIQQRHVVPHRHR